MNGLIADLELLVEMFKFCRKFASMQPFKDIIGGGCEFPCIDAHDVVSMCVIISERGVPGTGSSH